MSLCPAADGGDTDACLEKTVSFRLVTPVRRAILALLLLAAGCTQTPDSPESSPSIVVNSDGTSLPLSEFPPVLSPEQLCQVINELEKTPVDVFTWCPNLGGDVGTYPSKVAQAGYSNQVSDEEWNRFHPRMRRQRENVCGFITAGHDLIEILSRQTRPPRREGRSGANPLLPDSFPQQDLFHLPGRSASPHGHLAGRQRRWISDRRLSVCQGCFFAGLPGGHGRQPRDHRALQLVAQSEGRRPLPAGQRRRLVWI